MPIKKYNFVPEHQLNTLGGEVSDYTVTITSNGIIYLNPFVVKMYELDKKIVRLYADVANKTIAWTEVTGGDLSSLKNVRQINAVKDYGFATLSITKILKQFGVAKDILPMKGVPVTTYKDSLVEGEFKVIDLRPYIKVKTD